MGVPETRKKVGERMALKGAPAWQWAELYNPTGDDVTPQSHLIIIFTRIEIIWQARSIILFCEEAKTKMWQLKPKNAVFLLVMRRLKRDTGGVVNPYVHTRGHRREDHRRGSSWPASHRLRGPVQGDRSSDRRQCLSNPGIELLELLFLSREFQTSTRNRGNYIREWASESCNYE